MDREEYVAHITASFRSVVETLFDEAHEWSQGQWLAAAERRTREAMVEQARKVLQALIPHRFGTGHCGPVHVDEHGQERAFKEYVRCRVKTVVGVVSIQRASYLAKGADPAGVRPLDGELGLRGDCSEGVEELTAYVAGQLTYEETTAMLSKTLGVDLSRTKVQHVAARWGEQASAERSERLPRQEPPARVAIAADGAMIRTAERRQKRRGSRKQHFCDRWREAKLGVIYSFDRKGQANRDHRYVTSLGGRDSFGDALWQHIEAAGADRAPTAVWLGDGAEWIWTLKNEHLPDAIEVLDFHHAYEHLRAIAVALHGDATRRAQRWLHQQEDRLKDGHVNQVIKTLQRHAKHLGPPRRNTRDDDPRKVLADNVRYFRHNRHRMNYKHYRDCGYPISSGVVESGCKHIIAQRMRITASMSWGEQNADAILQLRSLIRGKLWDPFWNNNTAAA